MAVSYGNRYRCHAIGPCVSGNDFTTPAGISFGQEGHTEYETIFTLLQLCSTLPRIKYHTVKKLTLSNINSNTKAGNIVRLPDFRTAVLKELQKFWNENIKWSIKSVGVQQFGRILTNLLQCTKCTLHILATASPLHCCHFPMLNHYDQ